MIDRLEFILEEAFVALRRNGMMAISAINTAAIALFIFGGLGYAYLSLAAYLNSLPSEFDLRVSVVDGATRAQIGKMAQDLRAIPGVANVVFLPKDVEWQKQLKKLNLARYYKDQPNPLPNQFQIRLEHLGDAERVKTAVLRHPTCLAKDGVRDSVKEREFVLALSGFVRLLGTLLSLVSFFTAGTLIYNTVHLTVLARKSELRIMGLVGASHATIRWPLLLEGCIQGAAGGLLAGLLLWIVQAYIASRSVQWLGLGASGNYRYPGLSVMLVLMAIGALLGILSAVLSVRKYLRLSQ